MKLPLWRRRQQAELDEEIAAHLRMAIDERVARGETPEEARRAAEREFGNVLLVRETTRDMWGWTSLDRLRQDVRFALRTLARSPGFTAAALLTLALGIGANVALFSVIHAVVLRPLPFPEPDRLVAVANVDLGGATRTVRARAVSFPNYLDWRTGLRTFEGLAVYRQARFTFVEGGAARQLAGAIVSSNFFSTVGVQPAIGRQFREEEDDAGSNVVMLSDESWKTLFGGDPDIAGRTITLDRRPFTVVGVMPPGFAFPITFPPPQLWATVANDARTEAPGDTPLTVQRGANYYQAIGRLKDGVTTEEARADLDVLTRALAKQYPDAIGTRDRAVVVPQLEQVLGDTKYELLVLQLGVACVLVIVCVNIANLLLTRGVGRAREMALRAALGASGGRLVRQLLTESLVLAAAGSALGLLLAYASVGLIVRLSPTDVRGLDQVAVDGPVIAFAVCIAALGALVFGLFPAVHASRTRQFESLKQGTARAGSGRRPHLWRNGLVFVQTALGVVLLVGAGLVVRSFANLAGVSTGFDSREVLTLKFALPDAAYPYERQVRFYEELLPALQALPGVQAAAGVMPLPLGGQYWGTTLELPGQPPTAVKPSAAATIVSPGYFRALGIELLRGREFTERDGLTAPRVAIVSESFAARLFPGEDPVGKRIKPGVMTTETDTPWREIVGVVKDVKLTRLSDEGVSLFYMPYAQGLITSLHIVVRSPRFASGLVEDVSRTIRARDPELAITDVRTMDEYLDRSLSNARFDTLLLAVFAGLGLVLTAVGLYGVTSNAVTERTHEFGVRMALGATGGAIVFAALRRGLLLAAAGVAVGILASRFAATLLASLLYGVTPLDPVTFAAVAGIMLLVALLACWVPARRAGMVNPLQALRQE